MAARSTYPPSRPQRPALHPFPWAPVLVASAITFAITSLGWMFFTYLALRHQSESAEPPFAVSLELPEEVQLGEVFTVRATAQNTSEVAQVWSTLDVYDDFLQNFRLEGSNPEILSREHFYNFTVLGYDIDLPPGASASVDLTLRATHAGTFGGSFDFCDPTENFVSAYAEISVVEQEAIPVPPGG